jgi:dimethylhistidine N-methyltransferase
VVADLLAAPARIAPKYFYDELGCAIYGGDLPPPEYYPTRTEVELFREHRSEIATAVGSGRQFVDLGAGDCCKAEGWLPFVSPARYIAVDIAGPEIARALDRMAPDHPDTEMIGVVTDFSSALDLEGILDERPATFFYPGSSIGNFTPEEAVRFMANLQRHCASRPGSGLLIGVDAKKAKTLLDAAYDDALGVTAAFNRNALAHLNRPLRLRLRHRRLRASRVLQRGGGRIEMHLESLRDQAVHLGELRGASRRRSAFTPRTPTSIRGRSSSGCSGKRASGGLECWSTPEGSYHVFYAR